MMMITMPFPARKECKQISAMDMILGFKCNAMDVGNVVMLLYLVITSDVTSEFLLGKKKIY